MQVAQSFTISDKQTTFTVVSYTLQLSQKNIGTALEQSQNNIKVSERFRGTDFESSGRCTQGQIIKSFN